MSYTVLYEKFAQWLDEILKGDFPDNTAALVFNLYEHFDQEHCWYAELGFCECFDADDKTGDWACYAKLCEPVFMWDSDTEWEAAQNTAEKLVSKYLSDGRYSKDIMKLHGVGVGFAEGDLKLVYINNNSQAECSEYPRYDPDRSKELIEQKAQQVFDFIMKKQNDK